MRQEGTKQGQRQQKRQHTDKVRTGAASKVDEHSIHKVLDFLRQRLGPTHLSNSKCQLGTYKDTKVSMRIKGAFPAAYGLSTMPNAT